MWPRAARALLRGRSGRRCAHARAPQAEALLAAAQDQGEHLHRALWQAHLLRSDDEWLGRMGAALLDAEAGGSGGSDNVGFVRDVYGKPAADIQAAAVEAAARGAVGEMETALTLLVASDEVDGGSLDPEPLERLLVGVNADLEAAEGAAKIHELLAAVHFGKNRGQDGFERAPRLRRSEAHLRALLALEGLPAAARLSALDQLAHTLLEGARAGDAVPVLEESLAILDEPESADVPGHVRAAVALNAANTLLQAAGATQAPAEFCGRAKELAAGALAELADAGEEVPDEARDELQPALEHTMSVARSLLGEESEE